jgi:putative transposase
MTTKRTSHSVYNLNYHIVLVTKYRNQVLIGDIETFVKERIGDICLQYGWELLELEVLPEHVHLFVSAPPKIAPSRIAATLKSILAVDVFRAFPTLKKRRFWGSGLWTDSTYYGSAGTVSAATIQKYIQEQKLT